MSPRKKAPALLADRDYYCGWCAGHKVRPCEYCMDGCPECLGVGEVACPDCNGGGVPIQPPEYL
jgi:hypothetical protein